MPLKETAKINQVWSKDFMHDKLADQRKFQLFSVIDDYRRKGIAIEAGFSKSHRVLDQLLEWRSKPLVIRCDNGPGFISHEFTVGLKSMIFALNIFSRETHSRTLILKELIARFDIVG